MRLSVGQQAPNFSATDITQRIVSLADFRGKPVYLAFHRFASCPWCNFRIHQVKTRYASLHSKGLEVITVFESPIENLLKGAGSASPPFIMVSDPEREMYQRYGVESSVMGFARTVVKKLDQAWQFKSAIKQVELGQTITRMPADFLIDENGTIAAAHYGSDAGDHLGFETIEAWLARGSASA